MQAVAVLVWCKPTADQTTHRVSWTKRPDASNVQPSRTNPRWTWQFRTPNSVRSSWVRPRNFLPWRSGDHPPQGKLTIQVNGRRQHDCQRVIRRKIEAQAYGLLTCRWQGQESQQVSALGCTFRARVTFLGSFYKPTSDATVAKRPSGLAH